MVSPEWDRRMTARTRRSGVTTPSTNAWRPGQSSEVKVPKGPPESTPITPIVDWDTYRDERPSLTIRKVTVAKVGKVRGPGSSANR